MKSAIFKYFAKILVYGALFVTLCGFIYAMREKGYGFLMDLICSGGLILALFLFTGVVIHALVSAFLKNTQRIKKLNNKKNFPSRKI